MWTLFTQALSKGHSTTQVSIMNTSTNFMVTAFLGFMIFAESLPPLWWLGATLLVAGNVIIGRKEEEAKNDASDVVGPGEADADVGDQEYSAVPQEEGVEPTAKDEDFALIGDLNDSSSR
jgi:hypothetical protein